jgi:hypothetical protein
MIGTALSYIRQRLDAHLRSAQGLDSDDGTADRVVFLESDKLDPLSIPQRSIAMLVVNVREEREFRDADRYQRRLAPGPGGGSERHYPDIHLEIAILFIAYFKDYTTAWDQLSQVLVFFQAHPVFDPAVDKDLPAGIGRLANELCSQSFQEQSELWSAVKSPLRPALLHRFRLITLRGKAMERQQSPIKMVKTKVQHQEHAVNLRSPPPPP